MEEIKDRYYLKCMKNLDKVKGNVYIEDIRKEVSDSFYYEDNLMYYSLDKIENMISLEESFGKRDTLFNIYRDVLRLIFLINSEMNKRDFI